MVTESKRELVLSNSQINTYLTCPMLYRHQYGRKVYPRKRPIYFVIGSAVHAFLEYWYSTKKMDIALKAAEDVFSEVDTSLLGEKETHNLECDRAMVAGICEAYPRYYSGDFDQFKTFLPEGDTTIPLIADHPIYTINYRAILALLVEDHAGDWWIIETKTAAASAVNATYFERVRIDSQVSGQMWVAYKVLGKWPKGVIYNVIKKPSIRLKKGETTSAYRTRVYKEYSHEANCAAKGYFTREEIIISKRQLEEWKAETRMIANEIANRRHSSREHPGETFWPKNTGACAGKFNNACAYMPACIDGTYNRLLYEKREHR